MNTPLISLILATVGRTDELDRMLASLAAQTLQAFEVVVVDQNTDDRLQVHLARARGLGIEVRHLKLTPPNLAAARNAGIKAARGEWIGFPDDDCWYESNVLEIVDKRFKQSDKPSGVVVRWAEESGLPLVPACLSWKRSCMFRDVPVSSITLFCSRALCLKIGGFDSRFGVGQWFGAGEETDFVLRALQTGALFTYEPSAQVHHAVSSGRSQATPQARAAMRHRARGTGALYAKHRLPLWVVVRGLVAPILRPMLKGTFGADLVLGCVETLGRLDGLLGWRKQRY